PHKKMRDCVWTMIRHVHKLRVFERSRCGLMLKIAVIGLQGAVSEHIVMVRQALQNMGIEGSAVWADQPEELSGVHGVIIPGGESTTIGKLMQRTGTFEVVRRLGESGVPIMGTCAGLILLAKKGDEQVVRTGQPLLGLMDMEVVRNAFGRQRESFETDVRVEGLKGGPFRGVFIRAPAVERVWGEARVVAEVEGRIVGVRQGKLLALSFHPELTDDTRLHEHFLELCRGGRPGASL
ncbi:MAG: pyridoxal 5'-phosphate synthase glutaminase subunit PdxT, partial [Candidatus Hadarchaeales archaeon]